MLGPGERRAAAFADQAQEVLGDLGHRPPGAPLPRGVGGRVDDDLTDDPPTLVMGFAAGDEEVGKRLRDDDAPRLGSMDVQMTEGLRDSPAASDRPGELVGRPPRS
jgi:hypothetical protein